MAVEVLPMLEAEAKGRQEASRFNGGGNISTTDQGKARDQAAVIASHPPANHRGFAELQRNLLLLCCQH